MQPVGTVLIDPATAFAVVPAGNPEPPANQGPEFGKASPIGLVVILLLALATIVLIRSMTKRIKRLPATFDDAPSPDRLPEP